MVCQDKLACFTLEKHVKELVVHGEWEFSFSTFATRFKFPKLFLLFLLTVKSFLAALLSDMKCLLQHYSDINFSWVIKAWHFLFLPWKVAGKCLKCWLLFWSLGTAIVVICSNYHDSITREILQCMLSIFYYSFKIFPHFWLVKTTCIIHHNQLLLTKFGKNFVILNQWLQNYVKRATWLRVIELLTVKTWGGGWVVLVVRTKWRKKTV